MDEHIQNLQPKLQSTVVTFRNQQTIEVPVSLAVMKKQISRTESCIVSFSKQRKRQLMYYSERSFPVHF
jgi:competence transcription factor ComK